jgi:hypothetical protein
VASGQWSATIATMTAAPRRSPHGSLSLSTHYFVSDRIGIAGGNNPPVRQCNATRPETHQNLMNHDKDHGPRSHRRARQKPSAFRDTTQLRCQCSAQPLLTTDN